MTPAERRQLDKIILQEMKESGNWFDWLLATLKVFLKMLLIVGCFIGIVIFLSVVWRLMS